MEGWTAANRKKQKAANPRAKERGEKDSKGTAKIWPVKKVLLLQYRMGGGKQEHRKRKKGCFKTQQDAAQVMHI